MTDTIARLRVGKVIFETMVDMENAMKMKKGLLNDVGSVIRDNAIYTNLKKGMRAGNGEMEIAFETTDFPTIVERIVKKGEIELNQEFRDEAVENKKKQIIDFLSKNAVDVRTGRPLTSDLISSAIKQSGVKIENLPIEKQIKNVTETLKKVIPIKIETKKILIKIPAQYTGQVYGVVQEYKEKENWLPDGSLEVVVSIPVGLQSEFYDRLNKFTHGSTISQEIKE
jgi:ribosome maturation protein SDO1